MRDFVERLRAASDDASLDCYSLCSEAAARIEALEAALREIEAGCQRWRDQQPQSDGASNGWAHHLQLIARDTLAAEQDK